MPTPNHSYAAVEIIAFEQGELDEEQTIALLVPHRHRHRLEPSRLLWPHGCGYD